MKTNYHPHILPGAYSYVTRNIPFVRWCLVIACMIAFADQQAVAGTAIYSQSFTGGGYFERIYASRHRLGEFHCRS